MFIVYQLTLLTQPKIQYVDIVLKDLETNSRIYQEFTCGNQTSILLFFTGNITSTRWVIGQEACWASPIQLKNLVCELWWSSKVWAW